MKPTILSSACFAFTLFFLAPTPARAQTQTSYPMLMSISPVAVQIGQTSECEVSARYSLQGAYKVFVSGDGVTGEVAGNAEKTDKKPSGKKRLLEKIKIRFTVAANALPGVRDVRIATPQGVSTVAQLVVVRDPVIREAAANDTMETAQRITIPATACGRIEKLEDVDYYKFHAAAGSSWTFHVRSQRLENRIHDLQEHADPIITLRNALGTVLAANDNYFFGDPLLNYRFPAAGEYYLEIRDARYSGNPYWEYSIEINDRPFVTNVYPSCAAPGTTTVLHPIGYNLPPDAVTSLTLPAGAPEGLQWATLTLANHQITNEAPIIVSRLPQVLEAPGVKNTPAAAQHISVPAGICGRIANPGEIDCYAFDAKAGERFTFEVVARAHQSAIDSVLRILNDKGVPLIENDDAGGRYVHADSLIENWTAPANGRYIIEIRDLHLRGGPTFVYFLKVTRSEPSFTLETDTDKTLLAPGTSGVIFARVTRRAGFSGEVQLHVEGLPAGVKATCGRILATGTDGCILLRAAPDAPRGASNIRVTGSAKYKEANGKTADLTAVAQPLQEIYMPGGGRSHYPVETHAVSVGDALDLKAVNISPTAITLRPGESKKIDVTIDRQAGFKQNVTLDVVYQHLGSIYGNSLPAGITVDEKASQTLLTGDQTKGTIVLKAALDAKPVQNQQVPVMAHVSINFVMKFTYCAQPLYLSVIPAQTAAARK
ncbi:MAG TPA: hypothetical protein VK395_03515 [Gemmataceae bacterium]|nr:hypothetical protein [Gemmataceae bacterium]